MNMNKFRISLVLGGVALSAAACTTTPSGGSLVEASFGDAIRSNVQGQMYDPVAAANPSTDAIEGTDGQRMEAAMEHHRSQVGSSQGVSNPIVISVGE